MPIKFKFKINDYIYFINKDFKKKWAVISGHICDFGATKNKNVYSVSPIEFCRYDYEDVFEQYIFFTKEEAIAECQRRNNNKEDI